MTFNEQWGRVVGGNPSPKQRLSLTVDALSKPGSSGEGGHVRANSEMLGRLPPQLPNNRIPRFWKIPSLSKERGGEIVWKQAASNVCKRRCKSVFFFFFFFLERSLSFLVKWALSRDVLDFLEGNAEVSRKEVFFKRSSLSFLLARVAKCFLKGSDVCF